MINKLLGKESISKLTHILARRPLCSFNFSSEKPQIDPNCNYYEILMIERTASLPQIKKSYYQLIKKYHPDFQKGHESELRQIKAAYEVLSNEFLRKQYDQMTADKAGFKEKAFQEKQEEYSTGSGPYQTQEEYQDYATKGQYNLGPAQWHKTRIGLKRQSYVSLESSLFQKQGAQSDEQITHYHKKNIYLSQQQKLKNLQGPSEQKIRQKSSTLRQQHLQRVEKAKIALERQYEWKFFKAVKSKLRGWLGKKQS